MVIVSTQENRSPGRLQITAKENVYGAACRGEPEGLAKQKQPFPITVTKRCIVLQPTPTPDTFGTLDL